MNACLARDSHKVRIAEPPWQHVQMDVAGNTGTCSASKVHAEIHAVWFVICSIDGLDSLREAHYFAQSIRIASAEFCYVRVRNDHHMAGSVWVTIENDERLRAAINNQRLGFVFARGGVAENAVRLYAACRFFHVLVAPGSPEIVHEVAWPRKRAACTYNAVGTLNLERGRRRRRFRHPRCLRNL